MTDTAPPSADQPPARCFTRLAIANRGEIACRIIRTARAMGIRTIAVYSDADRDARHVALADEARRLGPAPARDSYLRADLVIAAALAAGAEAIHPGYGFLSENEPFAEACAAVGLIFVGPPVASIRAMGSKSAAKELMQGSGVPLVPGYHGAAQDLPVLVAEAERIGYPVLVKASAGGGGKGMRVVDHAIDLAGAVAAAKREALAAFGDDAVLLEKYLKRPRHIEVQVFGDTRGNVVSLFERECTLQRRHQKVIEEAPAARLDETTREAMCAAARAAARAVGYVGAGTVEFVLDATGFYFIEMNTRLQVEHPVTEAITGLDLVEWQLRVASGELLPLAQDEITAIGHAFEARIYAEDPANGFLPSIGAIRHWREPLAGTGIRVDTGYAEGDVVTPHYDPMLAKLIVSARDRATALDRLANALAGFEVAGVTTNLSFLRALVAHPAVRAGDMDTGLIERDLERLLARPTAPAPRDLAAAVAAVLAREAEARPRTSPASPWDPTSGWMMAGTRRRSFTFRLGRDDHTVHLIYGRAGLSLTVGGDILDFHTAVHADGTLDVFLAGAKERISAVWSGREVSLATPRGGILLTWRDPWHADSSAVAGADHFAAPMPGTVTRIMIEAGSPVEAGEPVLVIEAMKMEHTLRAPVTGRLLTLACTVGDFVEAGTLLGEFKAAE